MRAFIVSWMFKTDHQRFIESGTCDLLVIDSQLVYLELEGKVEGQHHPKVPGTGWLSRMGSVRCWVSSSW
jgi:hypothetical protein